MVIFRTATVDDLDPLVALVTSAYRGDASRAGWTTEADLLGGQRIDPEVLRHDIERPRSRVLVLDDDRGRPVACAHVADDDGVGYFGMYAVRPAQQGGGVGSRLLTAAERVVADDWGLTTMRMTVIEQRTELIDYYLRRGYRRTGRYQPFPYGDERYGIPTRDDLRFTVLEKDLRAPS